MNDALLDYSPVIIVLVLIAVACIAMRCSKRFAMWVRKSEPLLDFLEIVGVVGLVLSLSITISQFRANESRQKQLRHEQMLSRVATLEAEITVNLHVCREELIGAHASHGGSSALPVPESRFHTAILEQALSRGDITQQNLRDDLWNAYRLMSTANSLLTQGLYIRHTEHIADPRDQMLISGRRSKVNALVRKAIEHSKDAESLLSSIQKKLQDIEEAQPTN